MQVVTIFIQNNKNENLIQKRSQSKGGKYGFTSGHTENNETNTQGAIREVKEELGIDIKEKQLNLFYRTKINKTIYNLYYIKLNIDIKNIELQKEEVEEVKWCSKKDIEKMINKSEFYDVQIEAWEKFKKYVKE